MVKLVRFLRVAVEVVTAVGALLAAAKVAVETYDALRQKVNTVKDS